MLSPDSFYKLCNIANNELLDIYVHPFYNIYCLPKTILLIYT